MISRRSPRTRYGMTYRVPGTTSSRAPDTRPGRPRFGSAAKRSTAASIEGKAVILSVPSVVVPTERNYVLNPAHVGHKRIQIGEAFGFSFDPRMWQGK
jgi:RES domain-containing protein